MAAEKMEQDIRQTLNGLVSKFRELRIADQIDFDKFYLYSIVTHSTAIEGSTVTERENALMFDDGILPGKRNLTEQLMNLDLKRAYERAFVLFDGKRDITMHDLQQLSAAVMKNTGSEYRTILGRFDSAAGDLRLVNVSAGRGGKSYLAWQKVPVALEAFCHRLNDIRTQGASLDAATKYEATFETHYRLVQIHPWTDGNGRMSRLVMNAVQKEWNLLPAIVRREHKEAYIAALEASEDAGDSKPFLDFMGREMVAYYRECIGEYERTTGQS